MEFLDCRLMKTAEFSIERGYQPFDAIFYILEGSFSLSVEGETRTVARNDVVFFPSDMLFERRVIEPISFYHVRVQGNGKLLRGVRTVRAPQRMLATLSALEVLTKLGEERGELKSHFLQDLFAQLDFEQIEKKPALDGLVGAAVRYFEKNMTGKIQLDDVARALGVSVSGLIQHFRARTGTTPMRYLNQMRLTQAETLLCTSDRTLADIAEQCGFDNAFYFSNVFRKARGVSPSNYRKGMGI